MVALFHIVLAGGQILGFKVDAAHKDFIAMFGLVGTFR